MLQRLRQKAGYEFEASLAYKVRSYPKNQKSKTLQFNNNNRKEKGRKRKIGDSQKKKRVVMALREKILGSVFIMRLGKELGETEP